jgi:oligosaccharide repeat unit polymerase
MNLFLFLLLSFAILLSLITNRDLFTPGKLYLATILIFYFDIFVSNYSFTTNFIFLFLIFLGFTFVAIEDKYNFVFKKFKTRISHLAITNPNKIAIILWIFSLPSIASQLFMINTFGGIIPYINTIDLRVREWQGYGFFVILGGLISTISLLYFLISLKANKRFFSPYWFFFLTHLFLTILITVFFGGRGHLLGIFLAMFFSWHYMVARIKIVSLVFFLTLLISASLFLGSFRSNLRFDDQGNFYSNIQNSYIDSSFLKYGLTPIEFLYKSSDFNLSNGKTYLAAITNLIPRAIIDEKFDSGGVAFTKIYQQIYSDTSHITPTAIGEGIINFGLVPGFLFGIFLVIFSYFISLKYYLRLNRINIAGNELNYFFYLLTYYYISELPGAFVKGEFAVIASSKLIVLLYCYFIYIALKKFAIVRDV